MQHDPDIARDQRWIKRFLCTAQEFLGVVSIGCFSRRRLCKESPVTRSIFSLFVPISAGQARRPALRVPIEPQEVEQGMAATARPGRKFVMRLAALSCVLRCRRSVFRAGAGADRLGPLQLDRGGRRHRQCAGGGQPRRAAPSGEPRQAHDPIYGVRGAARSPHQRRAAGAGFGARRRDGTLQARPACPARG